MKGTLLFLVFLLMIPAVAGAQDAQSFLLKCSPEQIRIESAEFFSGFSPGGVSDLFDGVTAAQLMDFVETIPDSIGLLFQGTADSLDWQNNESAKLNERDDYSVAAARANWAIRLAGGGVALEPLTNHADRGLYVYSYSCDQRTAATPVDSILQRVGRLETALAAARQEIGELRSQPPQVVRETASGVVLRDDWAMVLGTSLFWASGEDPFVLPVAGVRFAQRSGYRWELSLLGGWRPADNQEDEKTYQATAAGELALFGTNRHTGLVLGFAGFWQVFQDGDEYARRVWGPYAGPQFRRERFSASLVGFWANQDSWTTEPRWQWGLGLNARFIF